MAVEIRPLRPSDDRTRFRSGTAELDLFFHRYAGQNQFKHYIGTTYVSVEGEAILGFATVSAARISMEDLPPKRRRSLPRYPLPVLRLARLAVDESAKGRGVGLALLMAVLELAVKMAEMAGCVGVLADAKPDAVTFHEKHGFQALATAQGELGDRPRPTPMFLTLEQIPTVRRES